MQQLGLCKIAFRAYKALSMPKHTKAKQAQKKLVRKPKNENCLKI
jgi:hypothetical protein